MSNTLHIPEFAQGVLFAWSQEAFMPFLNGKVEDTWYVARDVPMSSAQFREYEDYDLNFWFDEDDNKWHCTAYAVWYDEDEKQHTKTDEWLRLW